MISAQQKLALFLDIHRAIEEAATEALAQAASPTESSISYPPNGGLSERTGVGAECEPFQVGNLTILKGPIFDNGKSSKWPNKVKLDRGIGAHLPDKDIVIEGVLHAAVLVSSRGPIGWNNM